METQQTSDKKAGKKKPIPWPAMKDIGQLIGRSLVQGAASAVGATIVYSIVRSNHSSPGTVIPFPKGKTA